MTKATSGLRFLLRNGPAGSGANSGARFSAGNLAPEFKVAGCYTPRSASRRPEPMAAVKAWKSCSFWSAYAAAKSAIALSNTADPPR